MTSSVELQRVIEIVREELNKAFPRFLSEKAKERKPISISYLLKKLDRDMPKLARLAMLDIQSDIEESQRQQEEAKKIISEKYYI